MTRKVALLPALIIAVAAWCQATTRTRTAEISGKEMEYRWDKNEFDFSGGCVLTIHGPTTATLKAPRIIFQLTADGQSVQLLKAFGPVEFSSITAPDEKGNRRKITGQCTQYATYAEKDGVIEVVGNAVVDLVTLPETPESARAHFSGDTISINLKKGIIRATPAHLRYEGILPQPSPAEKREPGEGKGQ
ncbi:MAG: hypothetical protein H5T86_05545 [Armatimonadetes bacterium]|nr:hypothetical protein [Armatimonadota bacterium]